MCKDRAYDRLASYHWQHPAAALQPALCPALEFKEYMTCCPTTCQVAFGMAFAMTLNAILPPGGLSSLQSALSSPSLLLICIV